MPTSITKITKEVLDELESAEEKFGPFNSAHEGYAVILEELDELWEAVKINPITLPVHSSPLSIYSEEAEAYRHKKHQQMMREEAIQVAAMAIRFVKCICDDEF